MGSVNGGVSRVKHVFVFVFLMSGDMDNVYTSRPVRGALTLVARLTQLNLNETFYLKCQ